MPELTTPDITLWFEVDGDGPPVFLIPGMLSDSASWQPLVPALAEKFQVIRPDPRCSGRTRPEAPNLTLSAMALDILALADHLGHTRFHVIGHSLGGLVGIALAGLSPDRVTSLAVIASNPAPSKASRDLFHQLVTLRQNDPDAGDWLRALFPWLFHPDRLRKSEDIEAMVTASLAYPFRQSLPAMQQQVSFLQEPDLSSLPARVTVPALALLARDDRLTLRAETAARLGSMGFAVQDVARAGHALHWDQPQVVSDLLQNFLEKHSGPKP